MDVATSQNNSLDPSEQFDAILQSIPVPAENAEQAKKLLAAIDLGIAAGRADEVVSEVLAARLWNQGEFRAVRRGWISAGEEAQAIAPLLAEDLLPLHKGIVNVQYGVDQGYNGSPEIARNKLQFGINILEFGRHFVQAGHGYRQLAIRYEQDGDLAAARYCANRAVTYANAASVEDSSPLCNVGVEWLRGPGARGLLINIHQKLHPDAHYSRLEEWQQEFRTIESSVPPSEALFARPGFEFNQLLIRMAQHQDCPNPDSLLREVVDRSESALSREAERDWGYNQGLSQLSLGVAKTILAQSAGLSDIDGRVLIQHAANRLATTEREQDVAATVRWAWNVVGYEG